MKNVTYVLMRDGIILDNFLTNLHQHARHEHSHQRVHPGQPKVVIIVNDIVVCSLLCM